MAQKIRTSDHRDIKFHRSINSYFGTFIQNSLCWCIKYGKNVFCEAMVPFTHQLSLSPNAGLCLIKEKP